MIKKLSMMTLEEAIKHCEKKACGNTECAAEHKQLAEWLKELQAVKFLPSNLDEAAEEYANTHYGEFVEVGYEFGDPIETIVDDKPFVRDAFEAGAEWMAGQGETQEHFVIGSIAGSPCGPAVVCYVEESAIGDEVIVQIRKKQ